MQSPPPSSNTRPLNILLIHNSYQQKGGEDSVVESEAKLLEDHGHAVRIYRRHNDEIKNASKIRTLSEAIWSRQTVADIDGIIRQGETDIIHVHNTMPLVSPSVFWTAARAGIPVVHTLHNYRMACLDATFLRNGRICEDCLGKAPWRGVVHGCYRQSTAESGALASMLMVHRTLGTFRNKVTRYIALSEFGRQKLARAGLPADKISVKPNFVEWSEAPEIKARQGGLFAGRLSPEKGVEVLLDALAQTPSDVKVVGSGPLMQQVMVSVGKAYLGFQPLPDVLALMKKSSFLILPSLWYEGFPRTIVEAYASGTPVVASRLGAMAEVIEDGVTGLLFTPGDAQELASKIAWAHANPEAMATMGRAARRRYETHYSPAVNHGQLLSIYRQAIQEHHADRGRSQG